MENNRCGRVALGMAAALALAVPTVRAQTAAPSPAAANPPPAENLPAAAGSGIENQGQLPTVTVTGYIVPRIGEGTQPVATIDRTFIENQGDQTVSDVLQRLPQNQGAFTPLVNAGSSFSPGASNVNLYGLGFNATLVLIDGYRQTLFPFPQNGFTPFVDLNTIPLAAVDRIEILKDGASSLYGSDAIAGVVNVVLKDEYNGADIKYHYGISQRGDYEENQVTLVAGISQKLWSDDSKLSILTSFDFDETSPIDAIDRAFSSNVDDALRGPDSIDLRSVRAPAGNFIGQNTGNLYSLIPGTTGPVTPANFQTNVGFNLYNFVPGVQLISREQRIATYDKITFQPYKYLQLYDDFLYERTEENGSFSALPVSNTDNIVVPASNPFNPFGEPLDWFGRILNLGQRKEDTIIDTYRNIGGIRLINLPNNWFVDASFLYAESDATRNQFNYTLDSRLNEALSGTLPGFAGQYFNPFNDFNSNPNQQFINALRYNPQFSARTDLTQWTIRTGGDVFYLPAGALTVGGGAEYRSDSFIYIQDPNDNTHNLTGQGTQQNSQGKDYVKSIYGQIIIPILGGQWSWPGVRLLEFDFSERYDEYSSFGSAAKPKFSVRYKPFDDLTLRASYSESFRAPSLPELFSGATTGFTSVIDPTLPPPNNSFDVQVEGLGNPHLKPETGYGYYVGAVWSPGSADPEHSPLGWLNGFTAYIDWTEILRRNVIAEPAAQFVVDTPSAFPGDIIRGPGGVIETVITPFSNLGAVRVDAIDFGASYASKEYGWGKVVIEADASYLYHVSEQDIPNGPVFNVTDSLAGSIYTGPDLKLTASVFYSKTLFSIDTFKTGVTLNYTDSEHDVFDFRALGETLPQFVALTGLPQVHTVGYWLTFDWQISYEFGKPEPVTPETPKPGYDKEGKKILGEKAVAPPPEGSRSGIRAWLAGTKLTFGINDIFDTAPPYENNPTTGTGYDSSDETPFQRYFYVEIEKKF